MHCIASFDIDSSCIAGSILILGFSIVLFLFLFYFFFKSIKSSRYILFALGQAGIASIFLILKNIFQLIDNINEWVHSIVSMLLIILVASTYSWTATAWIVNMKPFYKSTFTKYINIIKILNISITFIFYISIFILLFFNLPWIQISILYIIYILFLIFSFLSIGGYIHYKKATCAFIPELNKDLFYEMYQVIACSYIFVIGAILTTLLIIFSMGLNNSETSSTIFFYLFSMDILLLLTLPLLLTDKESPIFKKIFCINVTPSNSTTTLSFYNEEPGSQTSEIDIQIHNQNIVETNPNLSIPVEDNGSNEVSNEN